MEDGLEKLERAVLWMAERHKGQARDGETPLPYITHPIEVMCLLRYRGGVTDTDVLCAGVLHDTVEHGGATLEEVFESFGPATVDLVRQMTRSEPTAEQSSEMTPEEITALRSEMLLTEISYMTPESQTIKLADRLSNLSLAVQTREGKKLKRYIEQTRRILEIIPRTVNPVLWDDVRSMLPKKYRPAKQ